MTLIPRQFSIIEAQFPGTKYTVALKKSEEQRLNTCSRKLAAGRTELEAVAMVVPGEYSEVEKRPRSLKRSTSSRRKRMIRTGRSARGSKMVLPPVPGKRLGRFVHVVGEECILRIHPTAIRHPIGRLSRARATTNNSP
jgi:hypothetical protein